MISWWPKQCIRQSKYIIISDVWSGIYLCDNTALLSPGQVTEIYNYCREMLTWSEIYFYGNTAQRSWADYRDI